MDRRDRTAHLEWRKTVNEKIPQIANRVFALRGVCYDGSGFHYSLENQLGTLMARINNFTERLTFDNTLMDEVLYEAFCSQLADAETSAARVTATITSDEPARDHEAEEYLRTRMETAILIPVHPGGVDMRAVDAFHHRLASGAALKMRICRDSRANQDFIEYEVIRSSREKLS